VAGAILEISPRLRQQRRRAGNEQAAVDERLRREIGAGQKTRIECRHTHHDGAPGQGVHNRGDVEFGKKKHSAAAGQHAVYRDEQAVRVEQRQRVQQDVGPGKAPGITQRRGVRPQVLDGQHRALGAARGAGRIQDRREVLHVPHDRPLQARRVRRPVGEAAAAVGIQGQGMGGSGLLRQRRDRILVLGPADHHARFRVGQEKLHFRRRVGGVQRQERAPGAERGEIKEDRLGTLFHLNRDPVARLDAELDQQPGIERTHGFDVTVGEALPGQGLHEDGGAVPGKTARELLVQIVRHDLPVPYSSLVATRPSSLIESPSPGFSGIVSRPSTGYGGSIRAISKPGHDGGRYGTPSGSSLPPR
jgi:hypothetical protein